MSTDPDIECMKLLQEGEDAALNEIMDRWKLRLTSYLTRLTGNPTEALELSQETFVKLYQSRQSYHPKAPFPTWLFRIATNLFYNQLRWKKRHTQVSFDDPQSQINPEDFQGLESNPQQMMIKRERQKRIADAIQQLSEELRIALILYEYEDRSYAEIAEIENCSIKSIETRIYRARHILREKLSDLLP